MKLTVEDVADPLKLVGLQTAAMTDSILTVNSVTGVVRKITMDSIVSRGITSDNGLTKTANNIQLGGTLIKPTVLGSSAANTLAITGLQTAAMTDSLVTQDAATGILRKITIDSVASRGIVAENAITKEGNIVRLGGALNRATSIATTATNTLAIAGLQSASAADSVVLADRTTGVLRRMSLTDVGANSITTNNGLTKTGNNIKLGGVLVDAVTTITTDATHTLAIPGLQSATTADSVVLADRITGELRRMSIDSLASRGVLADNGLTKTGNKIQLGGTLLKATTVDQGAFTMAFTNGNVGVGTATAPDRLTVAGGNASVTNTGTVTTTLSDGTTAGQIKVTANNTELSSNGSAGLQLSTGASPAARMTITQAGIVGVGTATPQATFDVVGSVAHSITTQTGAYTATIADHTMIFNLSGAATLTLPAASSCAGRTYIIIKGDATGNVLSFSTPITLSTAQTMPSVNYNVRLHIQSDGSNWWLIARF